MVDRAVGFSWLDWDWHPDALIVEFLLLGVYLLGIGPWRQRYGWAERVESRHVALFATGMGVLFLAEHSPLLVLSEVYLFSAHMLQHLLLILVVPPLLLAGTPPWLLRPFLRLPLVMPVVRLVTLPVIAFVAFNLVLVLWHFPEFYDLTLLHHNVHLLEHATLMGTALITWWPVLSLMRELPRLSYPLQMLYLFLQTLPMGFLGAVLVFSTGAIYEGYTAAPRLWGVSPLVDQQIGGLLMKVGGGLGFLAALTVVFFIWFAREESSEQPLLVEREARYQ